MHGQAGDQIGQLLVGAVLSGPRAACQLDRAGVHVERGLALVAADDLGEDLAEQRLIRGERPRRSGLLDHRSGRGQYWLRQTSAVGAGTSHPS